MCALLLPLIGFDPSGRSGVPLAAGRACDAAGQEPSATLAAPARAPTPEGLPQALEPPVSLVASESLEDDDVELRLWRPDLDPGASVLRLSFAPVWQPQRRDVDKRRKRPPRRLTAPA